jgi:hypothetical protein
LVLVLALGATSPTIASAAGPQVTVMYPVNGSLSSSPLQTPPHHHYWGNFAVDDAAGAGSAVYARFANANGTLSLSLGGTFEPCAAPGTGGSGVIVNVAINAQPIGRVYYAHLTGITKTSGAISNGEQIGAIFTGGQKPCWDGGHTHVEPQGFSGSACFVSRALHSAVNASTALGVIGGGYTVGNDQTCPAGAESGGGGAPSDGSFVSNRGYVYRIAGGAPIYVSNWATVGGPQPTTPLSDAEFAALPRYPRDGTQLNGSGGGVFIVAGGAPLYLSTWDAIGGPQPGVGVDEAAIGNAGAGVPWDHLRAYPADGTLLGSSGGGVFIVAGGAPLYLSSWNAIGGPQPSTRIDEWDVQHTGDPAAHLRPYPADGTFLNTSSGRVYRVAGGAPFGVSSWSVFGGVQSYVTVDQWDVDHTADPAAHLKTTPIDGTVVEGLPSNAYWSFSGGLRSPASASSSAVGVDDVGLAEFPQATTGHGDGTGIGTGIGTGTGTGTESGNHTGESKATSPRCVVPRLTHMTLAGARDRLRRAHCRLGKASRPRRVPSHHRLRVTKQSARPGTRHRSNFLVNVRLYAARR